MNKDSPGRERVVKSKKNDLVDMNEETSLEEGTTYDLRPKSFDDYICLLYTSPSPRDRG